MKHMLAVFLCVFSAVVVNAQTPEPIAKPASSGTPVQPIIQDSVPCQRCGDNSRPYSENRWPGLFGRAITDWEQSPIPGRDSTKLTWWFIPRPRALVQALCP
jgi:hypothetical protein